MNKHLILALCLASLCVSAIVWLRSAPMVAATATTFGVARAGVYGTCAARPSISTTFNNVNSKPFTIAPKVQDENGACTITLPFKAQGGYFLASSASGSDVTVTVLPPSLNAPKQLEIDFTKADGYPSAEGDFYLIVY